MNTLMAGPRTSDLKLWFLFDELGALHRLPALEKGLQTARNYGGAIVAGVHAYAKLKETYGDNMAMTLAALARTKLIFATADRESATWCSDFIGHRQYREMEEGYSYGYNNARDAVSLTPRRQIEPLLLPDQLMNLPRLQAYLKFPDGFPAAPVRLHFVSYPSIADPFVARPSAPRSAPHSSTSNESAAVGGTDAPGAGDQGPGPRAHYNDEVEAAESKGTRTSRANEDPVRHRTAGRTFNPAVETGAQRRVDGEKGKVAGRDRAFPARRESISSEAREARKRSDQPVFARTTTMQSAQGAEGTSLSAKPENLSRRELREGIAPSDPRPTDEPELDF